MAVKDWRGSDRAGKEGTEEERLYRTGRERTGVEVNGMERVGRAWL